MVQPAAGKTAIKIPGKRTRGTAKEDVAARKKLNRPPGRPLKPTASESSSVASGPPTKSRRRPKIRTLKNIKSKRDMSHLERLPTELLQEIFLFCMNFNLPRSSPVIGGKLSSEAVYIQTILAAFQDTWEAYYRTQQSDTPLPVSGNHNLQTAVLLCRWASLPLFLRCQDICMRKRNDQRVVLEPILWFAESEAAGRNIQDVVLSTKTVAERFSEDFAAFINATGGPDFKDILRYCRPGASYKAQDLADETEIPRRLLLGPWTEESVRELYWLVKSGARLEWITSTSGEAALVGLQNAIRCDNLIVVILLLCAGLIDKLDNMLLIRAFHDSTGNNLDIMNFMLAAADLKPVDLYILGIEVEAEINEIRQNAKQKFEEGRYEFLDGIRLILYSHHKGI